VKTESSGTAVAVVVASAVAAAAALVMRRSWFWAIAAFGIALAVLDGREAAHQANLGRGGLEALAVILAAAHLAAAALAGLVASRRELQPAADR
jgi:hypothetical protein